MKIFLMNTSWNIFYTDIWWNQICGRRGVRWIRIRLIQNRLRRSTEKNIPIFSVMAVYTNAASFRRSVREADSWLSSDWATGSNKNEKTFTEWGFWISDLWPVKVFSVMYAICFYSVLRFKLYCFLNCSYFSWKIRDSSESNISR